MAKDKGLEMNYINTIKMVDTYLPYFDMEKEKAADKQIPENLAAIKASINSRENFIRPVSEQEKMLCEGYYRHSGRDRVKPTFTRSEKVVYSTDECIGCGICNSVCPHGSVSAYTEKIVSLEGGTGKKLLHDGRWDKAVDRTYDTYFLGFINRMLIVNFLRNTHKGTFRTTQLFSDI